MSNRLTVCGKDVFNMWDRFKKVSKICVLTCVKQITRIKKINSQRKSHSFTQIYSLFSPAIIHTASPTFSSVNSLFYTVSTAPTITTKELN